MKSPRIAAERARDVVERFANFDPQAPELIDRDDGEGQIPRFDGSLNR